MELSHWRLFHPSCFTKVQKQLSTCVSVRRLDRCTRTCFPRFYHCRTKVLISFVLACMSADWTGALVILLRFYRCITKVSILLVLVCLSADWAGALVLLNSSHSVLLLASFLRGCLVGLLSLGCTPFSLSFSGWCAGAYVFRPVICFGLLCLSLCVGCCLVCVRSCWCSVVLRVCVGLWRVLFFPSSVALGVFAFVVWGCFGLARSLLAASTPCPAHPLGWSFGAFWSSQCSAGPSLRVSGCICDGPVVMPVVWSVVTARLLSSLLLMATKASALCGVLPSTPCCGCCSGALLSCTEVFALGWSGTPLWTPVELHAPISLACAVFSLLSLLPSRAPSPSCCCWPPLAFSLLVPVRT